MCLLATPNRCAWTKNQPTPTSHPSRSPKAMLCVSPCPRTRFARRGSDSSGHNDGRLTAGLGHVHVIRPTLWKRRIRSRLGNALAHLGLSAGHAPEAAVETSVPPGQEAGPHLQDGIGEAELED